MGYNTTTCVVFEYFVAYNAKLIVLRRLLPQAMAHRNAKAQSTLKTIKKKAEPVPKAKGYADAVRLLPHCARDTLTVNRSMAGGAAG